VRFAPDVTAPGAMTSRSRFGRGRRPSSQQADDPCRAIKIVALTGQLCATLQQTPDRNRTRYSKSACRGPGKYGSAGLLPLATRADRSLPFLLSRLSLGPTTRKRRCRKRRWRWRAASSSGTGPDRAPETPRPANPPRKAPKATVYWQQPMRWPFCRWLFCGR
jgi:hypothetical protein